MLCTLFICSGLTLNTTTSQPLPESRLLLRVRSQAHFTIRPPAVRFIISGHDGSLLIVDRRRLTAGHSVIVRRWLAGTVSAVPLSVGALSVASLDVGALRVCALRVGTLMVGALRVGTLGGTSLRISALTAGRRRREHGGDGLLEVAAAAGPAVPAAAVAADAGVGRRERAGGRVGLVSPAAAHDEA